MQEQVKTGIQLQETLAQSAVDISNFLVTFLKARYNFFQQAHETTEVRLPSIRDLKKKVRAQTSA